MTIIIPLELKIGMLDTWVKVIPDFKNELVAAAAGESAAKFSADIGAVPEMKNVFYQKFNR